jgi:hypothetical protein
MKKLLRIVVVLVVLLVLAAAAGFFFIDSIAKSAIERGGTYALGVPTHLEKADVGITSGDFGMDGLEVDNPQGFDTDHFLKLGHGSVNVSLGTLRKETVELPALNLRAIDLNLEKKDGSANYRQILDHLKTVQGEPAEDGKRFIVRELLIEEVAIHADVLPLGGEAARMDFKIDEIRLSNVGTETSKGLLLSELAGVIVQAVLSAVVEKAGHLLPPDMLGDIAGGLSELKSLGELGINVASSAGEVIGNVAHEAEAAVGGAVDKAKDAVEGATEGIKDLGKGIEGLIPKK